MPWRNLSYRILGEDFVPVSGFGACHMAWHRHMERPYGKRMRNGLPPHVFFVAYAFPRRPLKK